MNTKKLASLLFSGDAFFMPHARFVTSKTSPSFLVWGVFFKKYCPICGVEIGKDDLA